MKQRLIDKFQEIYGEDGPVSVYFAPGRVNLIGDHTDYNGGHVFACAIAIGTYAVARKREDNRFRFYSLNYPEQGILGNEFRTDVLPGRGRLGELSQRCCPYVYEEGDSGKGWT